MKRFIFLIAFAVAANVMAQQPHVVFAHVSDLHIGNPTAKADLDNTINDINANDSLEFVVITGDITEFGSRAELLEAQSLLKRLNKPWHIIPGNHDTKWSESGCRDFLDIFGGDTFIFKHKGIWFIGTNSGPNMRMGPGQTPRENITWLKRKLKGIKKDEPVVYINHYPQNNTLNNWYVVLDLLRGYNVKLFLCGHGHRNRVMQIEGVMGIMGRSNLRAKDSIGGYNIVSIANGAINYAEKKPGYDTASVWFNGLWSNNTEPQWEENPERPDFTVNDSFPGVRQVWSVTEESDIGGGMAVSGEKLFYTNTSGIIRCVDLQTKETRWKFNVNCKIYSTPALQRDNIWVTLTDGRIVSLDMRNGKLKRSFKSAAPYVSSPVVSGDTVFAAGSDGYCRAWNGATGKLVWEFNRVNNFVETKPLLFNNTLYFGSWGNEFYALRTHDGGPEWKWSNGARNRMFSSAAVWPVVSHDKLYMVAPDRYMTALNLHTGKEIWRYKDEEHWVRESMGMSEDSRMIFVKTMQGRVIAFDAAADQRKLIWISGELGYDICPTPLREKNGVIFVPTQNGLVVALDRSNGSVLWKHKISNCLITDILPVSERQVVVATMDGVITVLEVPVGQNK